MNGERLRALRREPPPPSDAELEALAGRELLRSARREVRQRRAADCVLVDALSEPDLPQPHRDVGSQGQGPSGE